MADSITINGRYVIEDPEVDLLGEGKMGKVFLGKDTESDAPVAIKTLHANRFTNQPEILERFQREGELLRQLDHPNIVKLLGGLEMDGIHYLVMEFIEGGDLSDLLKKEGSIPIEQTLAITLELADALTRAHHLKVIHRDIKPANVLLAKDGTPRLTDFGIAHFESGLKITGDGEIIGTIPYLSPECCNGERLDVRSDVWSFGVLLYELLAGELPFGGSNPGTVLYGIMQSDLPDIQEIRPEIPDSLADLIYRILVKDPDGRIPSMRLVGAELEGIIKGFDNTPTSKTGKALIEGISSGTSTFATPKPDYREMNINLPAQSSRFVGRKKEIEEIKTLLTIPETRLVTLLGPGGMGKTRLGIEGALQLAPYFEHGVHFVYLAPIKYPEQIVTAIAKVFELQFVEEKEPKEQIIHYLRKKKLLLVMDNFEHVAEGASLLTDILTEAPEVKIVATSRARLNLLDERVFEVTGMSAPVYEEEVVFEDNEAVELFIQHARRARPDYELIEEDKPGVVRICQLVGGMPLGIQRAAGWVHTLSINEIAEELAEDMDFLESSLQDLPERQRSMRAVFEYSWKLLPEEMREIFKKLSVFRGGFSREAAREVAGAGVRELSILVNQTHLQRTPTGRFMVHELMRQFAADELANEPELEIVVRDRHWNFFSEFLAKYEEPIKGRETRSILKAVYLELDNILSAWDWAVEAERFENMKKAFLHLDFTLKARNMVDVAHSLFKRSLEALEKSNLKMDPRQKKILTWLLGETVLSNGFSVGDHEDQVRCEQIIKDIVAEEAISDLGSYFVDYFWRTSLEFKKESMMELLDLAETVFRENNQNYELFWTLHAKARCMAWYLEIPEEAGPLFEKSLAFAEEIKSGFTFIAQGDLAYFWRLRGDYQKAADYSEKAVAYIQQFGDNPWINTIKRGHARNYHHLGDYPQAKKILKELLPSANDIGKHWDNAITLYLLADINILTGNYDTARKQLSESAKLSEDNNKLDLLRYGRFYQGKLAYFEDELSEAEEYLEQSLSISDASDPEPSKNQKGRILSLVGEVQRALGKKEIAWKSFKLAVQVNLEVQFLLNLMASLIGLAWWLRDDERLAEAVEVVMIPVKHIGTSHYDRMLAQELLAELEGKMGKSEFTAAKERGTALRAEDIYQRYWGEKD